MDEEHTMMTIRVKRALKARFTEAQRRHNVAPGQFFSSIMEAFIAGAHVDIDAFRPEIRATLEAERDRHHLSSIQPVIEMIVGQWFKSRKEAA